MFVWSVTNFQILQENSAQIQITKYSIKKKIDEFPKLYKNPKQNDNATKILFLVFDH